jgi:opacity protein-like surface antigen
LPRRTLKGRLPAVVLLGAAATGLAGQQAEPAVEVFFLTGGYVHGNLQLSPQAVSPSPQWRPQFGAGILAPLGKKWGALFDVTTSEMETNWKWDGRPGAGPQDNFSHVRRVSFVPSIVRLWRRNRFTIYTGGGVGFEHDLESTRFRAILRRDAERDQVIVADEYTRLRAGKTRPALAFKAGVIVSLSRGLVVRSGYSHLRRYTDLGASHGLEAGIGYRF